MKKILLGIKFAISYFTLLPVRIGENEDISHPRVLESMILALPLIGILLASITISIAELFQTLGWLGAFIASVSYMVLYGFIHTEAILDVADALYAKHGGKDPYEVIKEPHVGAMGILYSSVFVMLKTVSLAYLLMHHLYLPFIAIAMTSRHTIGWLIHGFEFRSSFVSMLHSHVRLTPLIVSSFALIALGEAVIHWLFIPLFLLGISVSLLIFFLTKRSLGFANGDVLGISLEGTELILMIAVLMAWM